MKTALSFLILNILTAVVGIAAEEKLPHGLKAGFTASGAPYLADSSGRRITDTVYMALAPDPEYPLIWARQKTFTTGNDSDGSLSGAGHWMLLNGSGQRLTQAVYDYPCLFDNGMAICSRSGLLGSIDSSGKTIFPFEFEDIQSLQYGFYAVCKQGAAGIIRRNGVTLWEPEPGRVSGFLGPHILTEDSAGRIALLDSNGSYTRDIFAVSEMMQLPVSKMLPLTDGESDTEGIEMEGLPLLSKIRSPLLYTKAENILLEKGCRALLDEQVCRTEYPIELNPDLLLHKALKNAEVYFEPLPDFSGLFACYERAYSVIYADQNSFCLREQHCLESFDLFSGPAYVNCSNRFFNYKASGDTFSLRTLNDVFIPGYEKELERMLTEALKKSGLSVSDLCAQLNLLECCKDRFEIQREGIRFHFPLILQADDVLTEEELVPVFLDYKSLKQLLKL